MSSKAALKAAKIALDKQDFAEAATQARRALEGGSSNYHGHVFLALAEQKQGHIKEAQEHYLAATKIKPAEALAWQGLTSLFEESSSANLENYASAVIQLAHIYEQTDDNSKGQILVNKFTAYAKRHGSRAQYKKALWLILPDSPVYASLEGQLPRPSETFIKIAEITEVEEKEKINREIGERRTRLGARLAQVTLEVKREVYSQSNLEQIYKEIVNWSTDDILRREYEEKLLRRSFDVLKVLPTSAKAAKRKDVQEFSDGLVILKHPFGLAWDIFLEWKDWLTISEWDIHVLEDFVVFFPDNGIGKVLRAYMGSPLSPIYVDPATVTKKAVENQEEKAVFESLGTEEILFLLSDGLEKSPKSSLAHRLAAEYYLSLEEYETAVETARAALLLLHLEESSSGLLLEKNTDSLNTTLATALIYYQAPRNYPEAERLFKGILAHESASTDALVGLGLIFEEQAKYSEAINLFRKALENDGTNIEIRSEAAWCQALNKDYELARNELNICVEEVKVVDSKTQRLKSKIHYRLGVCIWQIDSDPKKRKDRRGAYAHFLNSIQINPGYAPAYTYLGFYYEDYAKDLKRARKCYQQAFDLSASEIEAAERLTRAFADQGEWDLVELIAKRVVDTGRTKPIPGKTLGISWPHAALGVVYLNEQNYVNSITAFQSALRIAPMDFNSWVGLGESYHSSGRYIAATKAFKQAEALNFANEVPEDGWFVRYMLANVQRELGEFDSAVDGYKEVLLSRPDELGVLLALIQTIVEMAWSRIEAGFYGSAIDAALQALSTAKALFKVKPDAFNLWKAVGDACSLFCVIQSREKEFPAHDVREMLQGCHDPEVEFADLDRVSLATLTKGDEKSQEAMGDLQKICHSAILSYKQAILATSTDQYAQAVGWFNLGRAEFQAHSVISSTSEKRGKPSRYTDAAIKCFRKAIELEASNPEFWNALGVASFSQAPKVAQHSLVRSLYLNSKNARTWTNLGTLYLIYDDIQLAADAFIRGQSMSPDDPGPWIGQGMIASLTGHFSEMRKLFRHAYEIADSSWLLTQKEFVVSTFDAISLLSSSAYLSDAMLGLNQALLMRPNETSMLHLSGLLSERAEDYEGALKKIEAICAELEEEYEQAESATSLAKYACATADLARVNLAAANYDEALNKSDTALQLSAPDEDQPWGGSDGQLKSCRLSSHLVAGLAHLQKNDIHKANTSFEAALKVSNDPAITCLLAQSLWQNADSKSKDLARDKLFDCVEKHSDYVPAVALLGAIGVLEENPDILSAVWEDLRGLLSKAKPASKNEMVFQLLPMIASLAAEHPSPKSSIAEATATVFLHPYQSRAWSTLAELSKERGSAEMALLTASQAENSQVAGGDESLAIALAGAGRIAEDQRSIMVAPWLDIGWVALLRDVEATVA